MCYNSKCQKEFRKYKSQVENINKPFCSRSCAISHNNSFREKFKRTRERGRDTAKRKSRLDDSKPISSYFGEGSSKYKRIRSLARYKYTRSEKAKICEKCGYQKHVEIAHIKPIHTFSEDTPISVVNSFDNLIALCPNCHWEHDYLKE